MVFWWWRFLAICSARHCAYGTSRSELASTGDVVGTIRSTLMGGAIQHVLNVASASKYFNENAVLGAMNFVSLVLPFAVLGWAHLSRVAGKALRDGYRYHHRDSCRLCGSLQCAGPVHVSGALACADWACGGGGDECAGGAIARLGRCHCDWPARFPLSFRRCSMASPPALVRATGRNVVREGHPRDELRYWLTPWKQNEESAVRFARQAVAQASPDGIILSDQTAENALRLESYRHKRRR